MAHSMTTGMLAETVAQSLSPAIFVEVDTNGGNIYVWSGIGTLTWNGQSWLGVGKFGGIDTIGETSQVQASGVSLSLSGIPSDLLSVALSSMRRYLPAKIWIGALDSTGAVVADPFLIRNGRIDTASIVADGTTATISVTVESRLIAMKNARERRYTDQDQKIEHPNDNGFIFVDGLQNAAIAWGTVSV